jgi:hypothetical protein
MKTNRVDVAKMCLDRDFKALVGVGREEMKDYWRGLVNGTIQPDPFMSEVIYWGMERHFQRLAKEDER